MAGRGKKGGGVRQPPRAEFRKGALEMVARARREGKSVEDLCGQLGISRATLFRWQADPTGERRRPGPPGPAPEVMEIMRREIRELDHAKRRTWGTEAIYSAFAGLIPQAVIAREIETARREKNRLERRGARRYEFTKPRVAWSTDFVEFNHGRTLRVQDECSRAVLGWQDQERWTDREVAEFIEEAMKRYGAPLFFKHDLGSEYRAEAFQSMLQRLQVIAIPNPPWYPKANGKQERTNRAVRQWLLPFKGSLDREATFQEMTAALADHNEGRRRDWMKGKTPAERYLESPELEDVRRPLYREWDILRQSLLNKQANRQGWAGEEARMEAMRLAAYAVLSRHDLVRYRTGTEGPEV